MQPEALAAKVDITSEIYTALVQSHRDDHQSPAISRVAFQIEAQTHKDQGS